MRHERELRLAGFQHIAGIDEVGRGSLAGPVVAAAVILPERHRIRGIRDSKVLSRRRREALYEQILDRAEAVGVGLMEVEGIDKVNGTRRHYDALLSEGPCSWHRRSFAPIRMLLAGTQLPLDLVFEDLPLLNEEELEPSDEGLLDPDPDWPALLVG